MMFNRKQYMKEYYLKNKIRIKEQLKKYRQTKKGKQVLKLSQRKYQQTKNGKQIYKQSHIKYIQSNKGKQTKSKYRKKYRENNSEKIKANHFISNLLRDSDFTRDICTICGKSNAQFHHENYELPNFGYWFCRQHHTDVHRGKINE